MNTNIMQRQKQRQAMVGDMFTSFVHCFDIVARFVLLALPGVTLYHTLHKIFRRLLKYLITFYDIVLIKTVFSFDLISYLCERDNLIDRVL